MPMTFGICSRLGKSGRSPSDRVIDEQACFERFLLRVFLCSYGPALENPFLPRAPHRPCHPRYHRREKLSPQTALSNYLLRFSRHPSSVSRRTLKRRIAEDQPYPAVKLHYNLTYFCCGILTSISILFFLWKEYMAGISKRSCATTSTSAPHR